uniref:Protein phosphatase 2 regulatory subunit B''alpha n=1 Tax=Ornithorhynchus anatinus TaxID=9258 RepID=F7DI85_ORNAN
MAAAYRLVVSTVNCYNSVVIDRRFQQAVHYCTGTCQTFRHGVDCIVAHHGVCAGLLPTTGPVHGDPELGRRFLPQENGLSLAGSDENPQVFPGIAKVKKGFAVQSTCNLKDIAGEAISFASGKIKEFSLEKIKNSNHAAYKKGRKVKSDSFSRRSVDFDLIYGQCQGDGSGPPFGLLRSASVEEKPLSHSGSLETNVASWFLQNLSEENLIAQILEKHKLDSSASGADIKMCLDILLKCSEDLKKCTDIIKQCIKKKSGGSGSEDGGQDSFHSSETVYVNVMTKLASYLKRLPFEFVQSGYLEGSDLTELANSFPALQPPPFSPIFGTEQPPKYEDVVQIPSSVTGQFRAAESQGGKEDSSRAEDPTGVLANIGRRDPRTVRSGQRAQSPKPSECASSPDFMETLFIDEESEGEKGAGRAKTSENQLPQLPLKGSQSRTECRDENSDFDKVPASPPAETPDEVFEKPALLHVFEEGPGSKGPGDEAPGHRDSTKLNNQEEIDRLLLDLECFSQKMESTLREPFAAGGAVASLPDPSRSIGQAPVDPESKSKVPSLSEKAPSSCLSRIIETNGHKMEEEDRALLLRILESIEDFAQELVECKSGRGSLSKEKEVMQILQETLTASSQTPAPLCRNHPSDKTKETTSMVSIQQTPEVIKVQNKQDKKAATPLPPSGNFASSPRPLSPLPNVNNAASHAPSSVNIPRFYFPKGLPDTCTNHEQSLAKIEATFGEIEDEKSDIYEMGKIAKACGCPLYWKAPMFNAAGGERTGFVSVHSFIAMWRKLLYNYHDDASKFVSLLAKPNCNYLEQEDFIPLLQDVVDTHPGLTFLKDAPEFHSRYITTTLALLEEEEDINQVTDYFSYEHFYVIYCKFWELDSDHDLYINQTDLSRYNDQASSSRIVERIFTGAVTRGNTVQKEGRMSYADFVWFLISEEDKRNPTSIEYWFRCMDLDGDGVLSMYELEYFYEEQCERMEAMGIEPLPFHDLLCQMLDLVKPEVDGRITLRDLKRCRMAHIFYDTFFNLEKYLDHEQRDPFAMQKDAENDGPEPSDWDRFAAEEYEVLVAEESASEQIHEGSLEDDETDEPAPPSELGHKGDVSVTSNLSEKSAKLPSMDEE